MALPELTPEQRQEALKKAAEARQRRAEYRAKLKAGDMTVLDALNSEDQVIKRMKVIMLLESLPGFGKAKAAKVMEELDISDSRRVQGLGARQREELIAKLGDK